MTKAYVRGAVVFENHEKAKTQLENSVFNTSGNAVRTEGVKRVGSEIRFGYPQSSELGWVVLSSEQFTAMKRFAKLSHTCVFSAVEVNGSSTTETPATQNGQSLVGHTSPEQSDIPGREPIDPSDEPYSQYDDIEGIVAEFLQKKPTSFSGF